MQDCKRKTEKIYRTPKSVQELIPIYRISEDGIFELENKPEGARKLYDRAYLFADTNFATMEEYEKEDFVQLYRSILSSLNVSFKITIMNNNRDMQKMRREISLKCRDPRFQDLADSLNKYMEESLMEGRAGIDQARLFIISTEQENIQQARDYFHSLESNLTLSFKRLQSALLPLDAAKRLRYLFAFYHMGEEEDYHFDFQEAVRKKQDWKSLLAPALVRHCQDQYGKFDSETIQIGGRYARAYFLKDYPFNIEDYMDIVNEEDETMFYVGVSAIVSADSREELERDCISFLAKAKEVKLSLQPARWNQLDVIATALPTGTRYCTDHMMALFTKPLATMVPLVVKELFDPDGLLYGMGHSDTKVTRQYYYYSNKSKQNREEQIERAIPY